MATYFDFTRTNDIGDTMGLEFIFDDMGVLVRYYAKGHGNRTSHKTYYFDAKHSDELHEFIQRETSGTYQGVNCIKAMLLNFDHWLHSKIEFDHIQSKFAKDSTFDQLKSSAEKNRYEVAESLAPDSYSSYFAKVI